MLSPMILAILLPSALAFATPRAAPVAVRQADDICQCEPLEGGALWPAQPSHDITTNICVKGSGSVSCVARHGSGQLCVESEDDISCACVAAAAAQWENDEGGVWYLCNGGNVTIARQ
ncbi:predicted protein [Chaetomium globosum CBS 148.51]|uniref:Cyanovirin-N domain-containing protein n=1 Tax=Chaetomium globosum (strain ATCC 6205 / CBS 148.51 / DSM 1962 / NBRC 6347 / NRRL 1970) TaxID=306901 RepID=Q2HBW6_CHAGB|nr:uncharacterized protein CHGG_02288 [Chaetomium globosum CBS 148.51]EAQ90353.1 predicted protein [Chaetomium globosum CBS 148.51]